MGFQVSPGVNTSEIDLTTIVPGISSIDAGFAGAFRWGPVNDVTLIDSEDLLVETFQSPDANTFGSFLTAANFLTYSSALHVVRTTNTSMKNASSTGTAVLISNTSYYQATYSEQEGTPVTPQGDWSAKWGGDLGNSLKVSICGPTRANLASGNTVVAGNSDVTLTGSVNVHTDGVLTGTSTLFGTETRIGDRINIDVGGGNTYSAVISAITSNTVAAVSISPTAAVAAGNTAIRLKRSAFSEPVRNMIGTVGVTANSTTVTQTGTTDVLATALNLQFSVGDIVKINAEERRVNSITNSSVMIVSTPFTNTATAQTYSRTWEYAGSFDKEPVTTEHSGAKGALYDEVHIIVVDEDGEWTGTRESALESFTGTSVAVGAKYEDGTSAYYVDVLNRRSKYVWWMDHDAIGDAYTTAGGLVTAWGVAATAGAEYASGITGGSFVSTDSLTGGVDGSAPSDGDKITAFNKFRDAEEVDIGLLIGGEASATVALQLIAIAEGRKDCVAFLSPELADVVNNDGSEADDVVDFRNSLGSSSYAVLDSGYKYQYDKYNDVYRYVPLCGDTAGVTAATEASRDAWFSPAGFNRGNIRNVIKLPFNPRKSERDTLYKNGVNPVTTFMGDGTVLFGDKTLLSKPSAFDRINVRRLFIILEKAISRFARAQLFEFNDAFTRAQFVGAVEPFLRNVQGRDGVTDFKVICDESNNTGDVVDRNEFIGDIYVKPNRSINFIQLNFVAVRTGVSFAEVVGG
jgi:hypothetical protein